MMNDASSNVKVNRCNSDSENRLSRCISLNCRTICVPFWRRSTPPSPLLPSDLKISTLLAHRWGASFRLRKAWQWLKWHTCGRSWIHVEYFHAMRIANFAFPAEFIDLCFLDMIWSHIFPLETSFTGTFFHLFSMLPSIFSTQVEDLVVSAEMLSLRASHVLALYEYAAARDVVGIDGLVLIA